MSIFLSAGHNGKYTIAGFQKKNSENRGENHLDPKFQWHMLFVAGVGFSMMGKRTAGRCEILVANIKKVASCCASNFSVPHYFMITFPVGKNNILFTIWLYCHLPLLSRIIHDLYVVNHHGARFRPLSGFGWVYVINGVTVPVTPPYQRY